MDDDAVDDLRAYVLGLVYALFQDDRAEAIMKRLPNAPAGVNEVVPIPHHLASERVKGFNLVGVFSTRAVMTMDWSGGNFDSRYDVITGYVTPMDMPEHLGARILMSGQPGMTVDRLEVLAETLRNPPEKDIHAAADDAPAIVVHEPVTAPASTPEPVDPHEPMIGGSELVPAFDLTSLLDDGVRAQLETLRESGDFEQASTYMIADPTQLYFGLMPAFEPIIRLGVDGMMIGLMVDAPELGFVDNLACLYEFASDGIVLTDARLNVFDVAYRSVTEAGLLEQERGDALRIEAWQDAANSLQSAMGWRELSPHRLRGFSWGDKRRKPLRAPKGTKWRTDAGGNGVLALVEQWGDEPVRRPRSISAALNKASELAPAAALHVLREGLVKANQQNDPAAAGEIYRAMVDPLEQLGRAATAARAEALGALESARPS